MDESLISFRHVRQRVNETNEAYDECQRRFSRSKEEMRILRSRMSVLEDEQTQILYQMDKNENNKTIFNRLSQTNERIQKEIETCLNHQKEVRLQISEAELRLEVASLEKSQFDHLIDEVMDHENGEKAEEDSLATYRMAIENRTADKAISRIRNRHLELETRIIHAEEKEQARIMSAIRASVELSQIMKDSSTKERQKALSMQEREQMSQDRMLKNADILKSKLEQNHDNHLANVRRRSADHKLAAEREAKKLMQLELSGFSPNDAKHEFHREKKQIKKNAVFQKQQDDQNCRKREIVEKILREEEYLRRQEQTNPGVFSSVHLTTRSKLNPVRLSEERVLNTLSRVKLLQEYRAKDSPDENRIHYDDTNSSIYDSDEEIVKSVPLKTTNSDLIKPEFDTLWSTSKDENVEFSHNNLLKLETRKSADFLAKPNKIIFLDFELNKTYTKTISLTNVSNQLTMVRFCGISPNLSDLCSHQFENKSSLSPGMSTKFTISFHPPILSSMVGMVHFMTPNGSFDVPIECHPPQVEPILSSKTVDFGVESVGEIRQKFLYIENKGAMAGKVRFNFEELENEIAISTEMGEITNGTCLKLPSKSSIKCLVDYMPKLVGKIEKFISLEIYDANENLIDKPKTVLITAVAEPISISLSSSSFDLSVCTVGFLYQEHFLIKNTGNTARTFSFQIPKVLSHILQLYPSTGYVQAMSETKVQIKFQPDRDHCRKILAGSKFYENETRVMEMAVVVNIIDQGQPLEIVIYAILNDQTLQVATNCIDFGACTIHESVLTKVIVTNPTLLVENFGFLDLPSYVSIRPGAGFNAIMPGEKIELEIVFSPAKTMDYEFKIVMQSLRSFQHTIKCKGTGVKPPLSISSQHLEFKTSLYDADRQCLFVINNHEDGDEFTHSVPRIGNGAIFPVGPTSFSLMPPADCGLVFSPAVGTILPGEKSQIVVTYSPIIAEEDIIKLMEEEQEKLPSVSNSRVSSRQSSRASKSRSTPTPVEPRSTELYWKVRDRIIRNFVGTKQVIKVPCYITADDITTGNAYKNVKYDIENCLWIEVTINAVRPPIVVQGGRMNVNFAAQPIGEKENKYLLVENISSDVLSLKSTMLDPSGPFSLQSALPSEFAPGAKHQMLFNFIPDEHVYYQEGVEIQSNGGDSSASLRINVRGQGLLPQCKLIGVEDNSIDLGVVGVNQSNHAVFTIQNETNFDLQYSITLDSGNSDILRSNRSGRTVFDASPRLATIPADGETIINVSFTADHEGIFSDTLRLRFFQSMTDFRTVKLHGRACRTALFISPSPDAGRTIFSDESISAGAGFTGFDDISNPTNIDGGPVLIEMVKSITDGSLPEFSGSFCINQIMQSRVASKKGKKEPKNAPKTEFEISGPNMTMPADIGLRIMPDSKGIIESDSTMITIKCDQMPEVTLNSLTLTLKSDRILSYNLILALAGSYPG